MISTSFAHNSKNQGGEYQPSLFEAQNPQFDEQKTVNNGKIFRLTSDKGGDGKINVEDLEWHYLEGSGDFRSEEIKKLRDEADIIITNPPFSLFRDFLAWIVEATSNNIVAAMPSSPLINMPTNGNVGVSPTKPKQFLIIGNMNAITYKEVFPLIKENKLWLGGGKNDGRNIWYQVPDSFENFHKEENNKKYAFVAGTIWFTNLDHGRRHQPLSLMTMADNIKFSKHKEIKNIGYQKYDNYEAIEVPFVDAIPSDYDGVMGVPISFVCKYNPEQFEIIKFRHGDDDMDLRLQNGTCPYFRILIRKRDGAGE